MIFVSVFLPSSSQAESDQIRNLPFIHSWQLAAFVKKKCWPSYKGTWEIITLSPRRTPVSNAPFPTHTTNHFEGRGVRCDRHGSAVPTTISMPRMIALVLGACLALSIPRLYPSVLEKMNDTGSATHARAQHDNDGSRRGACWCRVLPRWQNSNARQGFPRGSCGALSPARSIYRYLRM